MIHCLLVTLTLNAQIATKVVCFSRLLKCLRSLYGKQCGPRSLGAVGSVPTLLASILNSSVMLGNYLQQTTFSDASFLDALKTTKGFRRKVVHQTRNPPDGYIFSVKTQIRCRTMRHFIRVCTVCYEKFDLRGKLHYFGKL